MNYSTIKKAVVLSMVSVLGFTALSNAQDTTMTTTTMNSSAKVFGGRAQYRTWSLGLNAGVMSPVNVLGGKNDFTNWDISLGYGATLRKQFGHAFGLELGFLRGDLEGNNEEAIGGVQNDRKSFETSYAYSGSIMGVVNVATVDFLKRENNVNFLVKAGYGVAGYAPTYVTGNNTNVSWEGVAGDNNDEKFVQEQFIPVGLGIKFKVSERVNFDLGYNMYFLDGDNIDGTRTPDNSIDKYSYAYGGLEFSLGSTAKPNLDWVNPVALMYDELKDPTLRQEVEALKGRVSNTEAGIKVDGSGCPLDVDADGIPDSKDSCPTEKGTAELNGCPEMTSGTMAGYNNIQFEFNSSVLRTSAYPALDKLSAEVRANSAMNIQLDGHASAEGTEEYNMQLSKDRANSVKTYLVNSGVTANKISTRGYGETRPVASNATEEGKSQNRRVEFRQK
jgi:OOP family OmpA-OmpF porin